MDDGKQFAQNRESDINADLGPAPGKTERGDIWEVPDNGPEPQPSIDETSFGVDPEPDDDDDDFKPGELKIPRASVPNEFDPSMIVTRERAKESKAKREQGFPLRLPITGGFAMVRELNLFDRAMTQTLPKPVQESLAKMMDETRRGAVAPMHRDRDPVKVMTKFMADNEEMSNEICIRGFLNPRLARNDEHLFQLEQQGVRNVMLVTEIDIRERNGYAHIIAADSAQADGLYAVSAKFRK